MFSLELSPCPSQIASNKKGARIARNQTEPLIEEHDFELRLLREFNKKLDRLVDQTVSSDPDAKHCYTMLKEQVRSHFTENPSTCTLL